jgi:hypothetical protein
VNDCSGATGPHGTEQECALTLPFDASASPSGSASFYVDPMRAIGGQGEYPWGAE